MANLRALLVTEVCDMRCMRLSILFSRLRDVGTSVDISVRFPAKVAHVGRVITRRNECTRDVN